MTPNSWTVLVWLVGLLWICPVCARFQDSRLRSCLDETDKTHLFVADNFNGVIKGTHLDNGNGNGCIIFLDKNTTTSETYCDKIWPQIQNDSNSLLLYISKLHIKKELQMSVLYGENCRNLTGSNGDCKLGQNVSESCKIRCLNTETVCKTSVYEKNRCSQLASKDQDKYIINILTTEKNCINCNNPKKQPEKEIDMNKVIEEKHNFTVDTDNGAPIDPVAAVKVMSAVADLASSINESSAALNLGEGVSGILLKETEPEDVDTVSFAYTSSKPNINIIDDASYLEHFSRSVTVSKEAFQQALDMNVTVPFVAVMQFANMGKDVSNRNVLDNEVVAVEMGAKIKNLTNKINITFAKLKYKGIPTCHSWNGEGNLPNWTVSGCETIQMGMNITCQCSHLTFFAILLAPLNETISSSDLSNLTIITQVGCGLSMFFLSIVLFMHFLLRKAKASTATKILIHLVSAMFFLNFTFLINNFVAKMKSSAGCKIMAALMHYFMLATFTWFAAQAFHLCLQLYTGGKIEIRRYVLKVSITSWVLPSIIGIILLSIGKYGEQVINTENAENNVAMCWITDSDVHYVVNIGYYAVVFLFTFTTFIIILSWLVCLKRTKAALVQDDRSSKSIVTILGLCCMLGVTWGFAFFAHGILRVPSYYIFTILNSFQGFFLFIYYYKTSPNVEVNGGVKNISQSTSTSSTATLKTTVNTHENPYNNTLTL